MMSCDQLRMRRSCLSSFPMNSRFNQSITLHVDLSKLHICININYENFPGLPLGPFRPYLILWGIPLSLQTDAAHGQHDNLTTSMC